jgi:hypothetical protein
VLKLTNNYRSENSMLLHRQHPCDPDKLRNVTPMVVRKLTAVANQRRLPAITVDYRLAGVVFSATHTLYLSIS